VRRAHECDISFLVIDVIRAQYKRKDDKNQFGHALLWRKRQRMLARPPPERARASSASLNPAALPSPAICPRFFRRITVIEDAKPKTSLEDEMVKKSFYEIIATNARIGDCYKIVFKDNPVAYKGIPVPSREDENRFLLQVQEPADQKGLMEADIQDIEAMKKC
jgi:hypothetical protein